MHQEIKKTVEILRNGGVILYPTDTIWGIGCDATNTQAIAKIYKLKQRHDAKSMLILMDSPNRLPQYIQEVPEIAWELMEVADKPLTIIYPGAKNLAPNLLAEDGSVGIRIAHDEFCENLIRQFKKPIVSTSANISGQPAPSGYADISPEIAENVDYVVHHRQEEQNASAPSQIIKIGLGGEIQIIRH
ncbi:MAG: threonylcarbamoyl-AMP synthase [Bacteroidetes bacterium]|jgi:L-threonylcarbamoyladenylate synthase|nr:threonylcarbamoyl-AMP synthase [Bacteroidota bacterium]